eukprot:jgi/Mesen1/6576/ME000336S05797
MASASGACCEPAPPSGQVPGGRTEKWDDLDIYINGPEDAKAAVIFITDVFGWEVPQMRKIADYVAANGMLAAVPDFLHGDPLSGGLQGFPAWIAKHSPEGEVPNVRKVATRLRGEHGIRAIGVAGFCWGGKVAVLSAKAGEDLVQAVAMFHPSRVDPDDIRALKVPLAVLGAEVDERTPPSLVADFKAIMADKEVGPKSFFRVFPKVAHGFAVRYDPDNNEASDAAAQAHADMLNFFKRNLLI